MSVLDFCLFTTIWDDPKEFEAGRFAADILDIVVVGKEVQDDIVPLELLQNIVEQINRSFCLSIQESGSPSSVSVLANGFDKAESLARFLATM